MSLLTKTWEKIRSLWPWGRRQITVRQPGEIELVPIEPAPPVRVVIEVRQPHDRTIEVMPLAIDTKAKRLSAMNVMCPWRGISAWGDGSIDQEDRQAVAFLYSGIFVADNGPNPAGPTESELWYFRLMAFGSS